MGCVPWLSSTGSRSEGRLRDRGTVARWLFWRTQLFGRKRTYLCKATVPAAFSVGTVAPQCRTEGSGKGASVHQGNVQLQANLAEDGPIRFRACRAPRMGV